MEPQERRRLGPAWGRPSGEKTSLFCAMTQQMTVLPKQARDNVGKTPKKGRVFFSSQGSWTLWRFFRRLTRPARRSRSTLTASAVRNRRALTFLPSPAAADQSTIVCPEPACPSYTHSLACCVPSLRAHPSYVRLLLLCPVSDGSIRIATIITIMTIKITMMMIMIGIKIRLGASLADEGVNEAVAYDRARELSRAVGN